MDGGASWPWPAPTRGSRAIIAAAAAAGGGGAPIVVVVAVVVESSARGELSCLGGSRGTFPLLGSEWIKSVRKESRDRLGGWISGSVS